MKKISGLLFTSILFCLVCAGFLIAQNSSLGTMDGVNLERTSVYAAKGLSKISGTDWQTGKLFEINYANNAFKNSDGLLEYANLGFSDPVISKEIIYCKLYPAPQNNFIAAMDAKNGKTIWAYKTKEQISNPVLAGDNIYFVSEDKNVYALDAKSGKEKWKFAGNNTKWNVFAQSPLVADGILYASTLDGKLIAVDVNIQRAVWTFEAKGMLSPIAATKENLFVGDEKGNIYSINKQGKQNWTFKAKGQIRTLLFAENSLYFRTDNGELYSVNAIDGELNWNIKLGGKYRPIFPISSIQIGSVLGFYNQTIFFTGEEKGDNFLFSVGAKNGQIRWKLKLDEPTRNPVSASGIIYFGSLGKLYAVDFDKGTMLWSNEYKSDFDGRKIKNVVSSPAISDNKLFIISDEGTFYSYR